MARVAQITSETAGVKFFVLALVVLAVIASVPSWRKRFLGKYAAISLAIVWLIGMALVVLR
jgi:Ca2+/Na+ antiporter